jgi:ankyrin repeat protein
LLAAKEGHDTLVRLLVENGADLESKDIYGQTPLSSAAAKGHEVVLRVLVEKGADPGEGLSIDCSSLTDADYLTDFDFDAFFNADDGSNWQLDSS